MNVAETSKLLHVDIEYVPQEILVEQSADLTFESARRIAVIELCTRKQFLEAEREENSRKIQNHTIKRFCLPVGAVAFALMGGGLLSLTLSSKLGSPIFAIIGIWATVVGIALGSATGFFVAIVCSDSSSKFLPETEEISLINRQLKVIHTPQCQEYFLEEKEYQQMKDYAFGRYIENKRLIGQKLSENQKLVNTFQNL